MSAIQTDTRNLINIATAERIACGVGGAAMMAVGLFRAAPGLATAAAGAGLVNRGACGHSYLYRRLGISTATQAKRLLSDEPLALERTIVVDASVDEVRDLLTDPSQARQVFARLDRAEPLRGDDELRLFFRQGSFRFDFDVLAERARTDDDAIKLTWLIIPDEDGHEWLAPSGSILLTPIEDGEATEVEVKVSVVAGDPRRKTTALLLSPLMHMWVGARLRRVRRHFRSVSKTDDNGSRDLVDEVAEDLSEPTPTSQVA